MPHYSKSVTRGFLYSVVFLSPSLSLFFSHGLAAVPIFFALVATLILIERRLWPTFGPRDLTIASILFIIVCVTHIGGYSDIAYKAKICAQIAATFLVCFLIYPVVRDTDPYLKKKLIHAACLAFVIALVLGTAEIIGQGLIQKALLSLDLIKKYDPTRNNRAAVAFSLLLWPVIGYLLQIRKEMFLAIGLWIWTGFVVLNSQSGAAGLGFLGGTLIFILSKINTRWTSFILLAGSLIALLAMPWLVHVMHYFAEETTLMSVMPGSFGARLEIWDFLANKIWEKPWWGWCLESGRLFPIPALTLLGGQPYTFIHPHNVPLQIWLDLGLLGVIAACLLSISIVRHLRNLPRLQQPWILSFVGATFLVMCVNVGAWQAVWLGTLTLVPFYIALGFTPNDTR